MRHLRPFAALAIAATVLAAPARAQAVADSAVQINYDQETDSTTVSMVVPFSGTAPKGRVFGGKGKPEFTWTIGFVGAGHGALKPLTVTSIFAFRDQMTTTFYNSHVKQLSASERLELVVDGSPIPSFSMTPVIGSAVPDERTGRLMLDRTYATVFAPEMLRRIAEAAEVEGRLHGRSFVIDADARRSLRALVAQLAPATDAIAERAAGR